MCQHQAIPRPLHRAMSPFSDTVTRHILYSLKPKFSSAESVPIPSALHIPPFIAAASRRWQHSRDAACASARYGAAVTAAEP